MAFGRDLSVLGSSLRGVSNGVHGLGQLDLKRVPSRLDVGELGREVGFVRLEKLDVGSGHPMAAPCLFERHVDIGQPLREGGPVPLAHCQLLFEVCLAFGKIARTRRERRLVTLCHLFERRHRTGTRA